MDPDPAILVSELQDANKKLFFAYYFFTFTTFFKDKKSKEVTKQ
jgi:hypothetical protein